MPLTLPDDLSSPPKREIKAGDLMTLFNAVKDKFGQITGADFASNPNIDGSGIALGSLPGNRIVTNGVGTTQLATDAVTTDKILAANVTEPKLAASAVAKAKVKLTSYSQAPTVTITADNTYVMSTALLGTDIIILGTSIEYAGVPVSGSNHPILQVWRDTATDIVYLIATNNDPSFPLILTGNVTFRLWYIQA